MKNDPDESSDIDAFMKLSRHHFDSIVGTHMDTLFKKYVGLSVTEETDLHRQSYLLIRTMRILRDVAERKADRATEALLRKSDQ